MTAVDPVASRPRLPDTALPTLDGDARVPLRARRQGTVLVLLDAAPDATTADYLASVAAGRQALAEWDGRVLVVLSGDAAAARAALLPLAPSLPVVVDADGRVAAAAGVRAPALVVTDQWGEAYVAEQVGAERPWLALPELEQWLRFLSIRCAG